jgi:hypothetical protein
MKTKTIPLTELRMNAVEFNETMRRAFQQAIPEHDPKKSKVTDRKRRGKKKDP